MARVREMVYEQWLHVVCREVVLQWLESERWCMTPWLHVVCREVVLHLARVNMQPWGHDTMAACCV